MSKIKWTKSGLHIDSSGAPCPFCGHTVLASCVEKRNPAQPQSGDEEDENLYSVYCAGCHCASGSYGTLEDAVEAWQKRNDTVEQAVQKEAINYARRMAFTEAGRYAKRLRTVDIDGTTAAFNIQQWCADRGINGKEVEICVRCNRNPVEFVAPDFLCKECWAMWWADGMDPESREEREQIIQECLENMEASDGEEAGQEGGGSEPQVGQGDPPEG